MAIAEVGADISFNLVTPQVSALRVATATQVVGINETIIRQLAEQIGEGIEAGETVEEIAERVDSVFAAGMNRSRTISRTEVGRTFESGRVIGYGQAGVKRVEWLSAGDPDVRPSHQLDGEVITLGETFSNGLRFPLDPSGPPDETINCRCTTTAVLR